MGFGNPNLVQAARPPGKRHVGEENGWKGTTCQPERNSMRGLRCKRFRYSVFTWGGDIQVTLRDFAVKLEHRRQEHGFWGTTCFHFHLRKEYHLYKERSVNIFGSHKMERETSGVKQGKILLRVKGAWNRHGINKEVIVSRTALM